MKKCTAPMVILYVLLSLALHSTVRADDSSDPASDSLLIAVDGPGVIEAVHESKARAVLVNIWATWCAPCVEKFPAVVSLQKEYSDKGLEVLYVSADFSDQKEKVVTFLASHGIDYPTYIKTGKDMEFVQAFGGSWSGALPVMFLYDDSGNVIRQWGAEATSHDVKSAIEQALK